MRSRLEVSSSCRVLRLLVPALPPALLTLSRYAQLWSLILCSVGHYIDRIRQIIVKQNLEADVIQYHCWAKFLKAAQVTSWCLLGACLRGGTCSLMLLMSTRSTDLLLCAGRPAEQCCGAASRHIHPAQHTAGWISCIPRREQPPCKRGEPSHRQLSCGAASWHVHQARHTGGWIARVPRREQPSSKRNQPSHGRLPCHRRSVHHRRITCESPPDTTQLFLSTYPKRHACQSSSMVALCKSETK